MKRLALALAVMSAQPALAFDISAMSDTERDAFGAEVRSYLMAHPEVLVDVINELEKRNAQAQADGDKSLVAANSADIFDDGFSFVGGNPDGDITVVEFLDYRCGYCRKAHGAVADLITSDGNIRFVVKEFPILGEQSLLASKFAIAARMVGGDEVYQKIGKGFYETFRGDVTDASLKNFAADLGLDADAVLARMDDPAVTRIIEENHLLAQRLQIAGTPSFVIGDQLLRGYAPLEAMQAIVKEERG